MEVKIRKSEADAGVTVVEVSGRVDKFTAPILGEELEVLIRVGSGKLAVDLLNADSISNEGLTVLLETQKSARAYQCVFGLLRLPLRLQQVFDFAGLAGAFKVYRTEAEAVRAFAGAAGQASAGQGRVVLETFGPGSKVPRKLELEREKIYGIGRLADNEICLEDNALSRLHARIFFEGGEFILEDLNSANGTFLADARGGAAKKIARRALKDGDRIELGESMLYVRKELR
jgi:anti-sigma B factor antagonist